MLHLLNLVEGDEKARSRMVSQCEESGWDARQFSSLEELLREDKATETPVIILSLDRNEAAEISTLRIDHFREWKSKNPGIQLFLILEEGTKSADRLALQLEARHVLFKPYRQEDFSGLLSRIAGGLGKRKRARAIEKRNSRQNFSDIIGTSEKIREVLSLAEKIASAEDTSVMITGECGTGKGAIARAIHRASKRASGPFIEVNCAAIPSTLLESEFFGYEKGAFTDAREDKMGLFECANGGTIFLDEVTEIDYGLQAKLLKFLDTRVIRKISGTRFLPVNVRVISATNSDMTEAIREKRFRSDLFYRLNVVELTLPPLRERIEDIEPIAIHYTQVFSEKLKKGGVKLSPEAVSVLEQYHWPGNIRELINMIERTVLLNTSGEIRAADLPITPCEGPNQETRVCAGGSGGRIRVNLNTGGASLAEIEREVIRTALFQADGNITAAARMLEVGRGTLRYKMSKYGIKGSEIKKKIKHGEYQPVSLTD